MNTSCSTDPSNLSNFTNESLFLTTQGLVVLLTVLTDTALLFLTGLLYVPLLRAAWKLPRSEMLPWILLNLVLTVVLHLARVALVMLKIIANEFGGSGMVTWDIPTNVYCRAANVLITIPYSPNTAIPMVFGLIEVVCLRRPALAARQELLNCAATLGIWVASFGISVPYLPLTYTEPDYYSSLTCENNEYNYDYTVFIIHTIVYTLSVYSVFLLYLTLSGLEKWKKSHRIVLESLICMLTMYNIQLVLFLAGVYVAQNPGLLLVAGAIWMLSDFTTIACGLIILVRYRDGRRLAKNMFLFCCRSTKPVEPLAVDVPASIQQT